jgi:hypothetical protein
MERKEPFVVSSREAAYRTTSRHPPKVHPVFQQAGARYD